jgi:hypothetical protein
MSRKKTMLTITERDRLNMYRVCRKKIRSLIEEGKLIQMPAKKVFKLTETLLDHYLDQMTSDLLSGHWDEDIKELMTK